MTNNHMKLGCRELIVVFEPAQKEMYIEKQHIYYSP